MYSREETMSMVQNLNWIIYYYYYYSSGQEIPCFAETEMSLTCSEQPATGANHKPLKSYTYQ